MKTVDVLIIGAATTGSYLAKKLSEQGMKVLLIDKLAEDKIGTKYDIFHLSRKDIERFGLPHPKEGEDFAFSFSGSVKCSAYGREMQSAKTQNKQAAEKADIKGQEPRFGNTIGTHLQPYTLRLNKWAKDAGAEIVYEAELQELLYDEEHHVSGAVYKKDGQLITVKASLVADCSGIAARARTMLTGDSVVENFALTPQEMFFVILRYVRYKNPKDYINKTRSWQYYKTWEAPQEDPTGAILGIGAVESFDFAETVFKQFENNVTLPEYEITRTERGIIPYHRPPYSMVDDGFVVLGDAACLNQPSCGDGITSAMVQANIVTDVVTALWKQKRPFSVQELWSVNKRYYNGQGKVFAFQLASLPVLMATSPKENDFFFLHNVVLDAKTFGGLGRGNVPQYTYKEKLANIIKIIQGLTTGKLRVSTIQRVMEGRKSSMEITRLYECYPEEFKDFADWKKEADKAWANCMTMDKARCFTLK